MKFSVYTLGCKVNTYESEYVINDFIKHGFKYVSFSSLEIADIYIINTCSVTNYSDQKSRKIIRRARNKNKDAVIIAMGCFVNANKNNLDNLDINIIVGNNSKAKVYDLYKEFIKNRKKIVEIKDDDSAFEDMELSIFNTRTRALLKIEDGCENFCSYCIIPYTRGKVRSKDKDKVVNEAKVLVQKGYKEIVLTGIHTGHYGSDKDYDLSDLLLELNEIDGLNRIRISSIEITELNDKFLNALKKCDKIADHMHIPLQAGCDKILKLMNRKYDLKYYENKINEIRKIRPDISITTDVIVGFPGETNLDFEKTINFVKKINFSSGHVFPYSKRENTKAAVMENQVLNEEKKRRSRLLIEVFEKLQDDYYKKFINKKLEVIPEVYKDGMLTGHTSNYLKVSFKGCENLIGKLVEVKILSYDKKILIGSNN